MSNLTIDQLPPAATLDGTEELPAWQDGATVKMTVQGIADFISGPPAQVVTQYFQPTPSTMQLFGFISLNVAGQSFPALAPTVNLAGSLLKSRQSTAAFIFQPAESVIGTTADGVFRAISGSAIGGGFTMRMIFSYFAAQNAQRTFVGLYGSSGDINNNDPGGLLNIIGLAKSEGDANVSIMHNDGAGAATKVSLGITLNSLQGKLLQLVFECPAGGASITYTLTILDTGVSYTGVISTNMPAVDVALLYHGLVYTGSSDATAMVLDIMKYEQMHALSLI